MTKATVAMLVAALLVALWLGAYRPGTQATAEPERYARVAALKPQPAGDPPDHQNTPVARPHPRGLPRRNGETRQRRPGQKVPPAR